MKAVFIELPPFERFRQTFLSDSEYRAFQDELLASPEKGDVIQGTGSLRKIRVAAQGRGKRGGFRGIYYWQDTHGRCRLFTGYGKNTQSDLNSSERRQLAAALERIKQL
ncbi:type II toxin-antitoxin system RelE/ParE family toxin [Neisseria leonii]|uniref:Type II toxin-antitoxin system RelE/ParE family toxin n=1 Tax=Neisseria leonii TaxID=2995413 RepID=A0A9X4E7L3_9NEIS|nr:type II toxin-antitoxin system RelE/ParE family toxin [Neisseria sp. 51.81]MDD9328532.1 type II toxin-antitoxin system RelE/ParE family toxin [Neisseria sp. 51.81]